MRITRPLVAALALAAAPSLSLAACGSGPPKSIATTTVAETVAPTPAPKPITTAAKPEPEPAPKPKWPKGYPKVVRVSALPHQVRNWYEMSGTQLAVAVAPGVWAKLPAGADPVDVIYAGVYDGFCASKKAFERKWLGGQSTPGSCW